MPQLRLRAHQTHSVQYIDFVDCTTPLTDCACRIDWPTGLPSTDWSVVHTNSSTTSIYIYIITVITTHLTSSHVTSPYHHRRTTIDSILYLSSFIMYIRSCLFKANNSIVNISSKRGNKNFYKGRGAPARSMGRHSKQGQFHIIHEKAQRFLFDIPHDIHTCELKPYIQQSSKEVRQSKYIVPKFVDVNVNADTHTQTQTHTAWDRDRDIDLSSEQTMKIHMSNAETTGQSFVCQAYIWVQHGCIIPHDCNDSCQSQLQQHVNNRTYDTSFVKWSHWNASRTVRNSSMQQSEQRRLQWL
jgi:hypothetical protein